MFACSVRMRLSKFARPEGDYLFAGCSGSGQVTRLLRAGKSPLKIQASVRGGHAVVSGSSVRHEEDCRVDAVRRPQQTSSNNSKRLTICSRHHSRDFPTLDSWLGIPCGIPDDSHLDTLPENSRQVPSMTDNREWLSLRLAH
jgi:hypothetical protein